jgi:tetratricopeptide (TPR) repeat protein
MEGNLKYIDDYFQGGLLPGEIEAFQKRIQEDQAFAEEVAFYLSARQSAKEQSQEEKKRLFKQIYVSSNGGHQGKLRRVPRAWSYIAAAAVVTGLIIGTFLFLPSSSPQQLADKYIKEHLQKFDVTMGNEDEMQKGLDLYNKGRYAEALQQFESIIRRDSSSFTAIEKAGIVSLRLQEYDKALDYFKRLENYPGLHANRAVFYQALTLLKRNLPGDKQKAKVLLQRVVNNNMDEKEAAQELLKKL